MARTFFKKSYFFYSQHKSFSSQRNHERIQRQGLLRFVWYISQKTKKKKSVSVFQEMDPETQRHLDVLGFDAPCTLEELKKRFKELIKKYHPDVNKDGLEMTQKIIASYNYLILRMS